MTKIVGILNLTPDSFSDGGQFDSPQKALAQAEQLFADGAEMVDVGAESTRPGAQVVDPLEEWGRVASFFEQIANCEWHMTSEQSPQPPFTRGSFLQIQNFSLDTRNPATAQKFLKMGGRIINDVSGFQQPEMIELAAQYQAQCWVNHFPGNTVDQVHEQKISSINQVQDDLLARVETMRRAGIDKDKIVLDPGIGFGKTTELNWDLLSFGSCVEFPVLIGHSKKRFLGEARMEKASNVEAAKTAIKAGAAYLRVHNPAWYFENGITD